MKMIRALIAAAALSLSASCVLAQSPFGNLTPQQQAQIQAKMKLWESFRNNNKALMQLSQMMMAFSEMENDQSTILSRDQARKVLAILKTWRPKAILTNDQAQQVNKQFMGIGLTQVQIKKMASMPQFGRGGRGFGGGARAGGGGGQRGPGAGGAFDISKFPDPKPYNPLNPDTLPFEAMRARAKQRMADFVGKMEKRAK